MTDSTPDNAALLDDFRKAMRHVAATVYAVTTRHEGRSYGILATAVSSLSFDPPSLLGCINRTFSLHSPLLAADRFTVGDWELSADHFMAPSAADRFTVGDWELSEGVPVLASAQSSLICKLVHAHDFGTHSIFIGELTAAKHRQDATPLTYFDRQYIDISEAPGR